MGCRFESYLQKENWNVSIRGQNKKGFNSYLNYFV